MNQRLNYLIKYRAFPGFDGSANHIFEVWLKFLNHMIGWEVIAIVKVGKGFDFT